MSPQKAPDVFVKMAKKVKDAVPNAHFIIVGNGNQEGKIRRYAECNGFSDNLYITGWVDNPMSYVELFDVACLLSRWEGFGLALPEYMMVGKPIVASKVDAIITWRKVMAKLTKYEKETIILFNEGEDTASIYTYNASLRKRLALFSKKHPDLCRLEKSHEQGGVTYLLDKSRLSIRLQPPYSEERRRKASENAKQNGFNSQME